MDRSTTAPTAELEQTPSARFLQWVLDTQKLTEHDVHRVTELCKQSKDSWDQIVCRLGLISEADLASLLATYSELRTIDLSVSIAPSPLTREFSACRRVLVVQAPDLQQCVAIVDPFDETAINGACFAAGNLPVKIMTQTQFDRLATQLSDESDAAKELGPIDSLNDLDALSDMASSEPVIRKVNQIIADAHDAAASDIHLEPVELGYTVRQRIDGQLFETARWSRQDGLAVVSRTKILAGLDIAERRRPQDGRFTFPVSGLPLDLRVSTVPTDFGESAVLRLLDKGQVTLTYQSLGYSDSQKDRIKTFLHRPNGLVLLTGPTGSGKTTSLYTFLRDLADGSRKILTIEDPIEYRLPKISQSQVDPNIDVTFASALRSFLRHDPDVMMVGEIRDIETARIAVQAALTGHLVLSTLHTNDAPSAITRLRDLGVEDYLIASTLNGVVSQRLVPRVCSSCAGTGCEECRQTGRKGRTALAEILSANEAVKLAIRQGASEEELRAADPAARTLADDATEKASLGLITRSDGERVLGVPMSSP